MLLEVKGLKTYFRDGQAVTRAVDGVDLAVDENEIVGLVGESGSGKTMTALSIMRLVPEGGRIEGGEVLFEGNDLLKLDESQMLKVRGQKIGMVFQEPFTSLNPVLCVGEQIEEVMTAHHIFSKEEARNKTKGLLRKARIEDPEKISFDYPHQLSGGQRQRIMIAMALALEPKLLIADEPTTALDVTIQSEILKLILHLKEEFGLAVLYITHDLGVINEVADRVFVMKEGKIVESGKKRDILKFPAHPYTKRLIEAIPKIGKEEYQTAPREPDIFISVNALSKSYPIERTLLRKKIGVVKAVDNVTLTLRKGKTLGLVGESASGKTTLGRLLLGLTQPDSGRIYVEGTELKEYLKAAPKKIRQMMQIVFQDPYSSLDPHMRMKDVVLEGPTILGLQREEREEIFKDVLEKVKLEYKDRYRYPHQFSGGQRQRIAIARALAVRPAFLVLDEPVSSLDVSIQSEILKLLKGLQASLRLTYLFISHDLRVIGSMSDEVAVMYKGKIVERAGRNEIFTSPKHPYTLRLLNSIPRI